LFCNKKLLNFKLWQSTALSVVYVTVEERWECD